MKRCAGGVGDGLGTGVKETMRRRLTGWRIFGSNVAAQGTEILLQIFQGIH
jgi:hypothetical protein